MSQIPIVDRGALWCSCDTTMPEGAIPASCPGCGRETRELLNEAAYNAKVMAFIESRPLGWGLPTLTESKTSWWARMAAAYEEALPHLST